MKPLKSPKPATSKPHASRSPKRKTRQRFTIREKLDLLRQFEAEGLTVAAFCKARGLKNTVYKWLEAYRRHGAKAFRNGRAPKSARPKYQSRRYALAEGARPEPTGPLDRRMYAALARAGQRGLTARALANKVGRSLNQTWYWLYQAEQKQETVRRIEGPRLRESRAPFKAALIRALGEAGRSGIRTRDLATRFGKTADTTHQVLEALCKAGLARKAARGRYRLRRGAGTPGRLIRKTCGTTRTLVLTALKAAGPAGSDITTLAAKLGLTNRQLGNWFANTGKTEPCIERIGRGVYRFAERSAPAKAGAARGELKAALLAELKKAGKAGVRLLSLAKTLGRSAGALSVWFATTGKNCPAVERLSRGVYRLRPASLPKKNRPKIGRKAA